MVPGRERSTMNRDGPSTLGAYALLIGVILILGFNWPLSKIALRSSGPLWFTGLRAALAAAVTGAYALARGTLRFPARRDWPVVLSVGLGGVAGLYGIVYTGLQYVPPGRSSVVVWTTSLWTVPIAAVALRERMNPRRWAGLTVGITGIVLLFEPWSLDWSDSEMFLGHGLLLTASVLQAAVTVHMRGHRWATSPTDVIPWQLGLGAVVLLTAALIREGAPAIDWNPAFTAILLNQAVLASAFAVWAQQMAVRRLQAMTAGLMLMAVPVLGLLASIVTMGETISLVGVAGVLGITTGVALAITADEDAVVEVTV